MVIRFNPPCSSQHHRRDVCRGILTLAKALVSTDSVKQKQRIKTHEVQLEQLPKSMISCVCYLPVSVLLIAQMIIFLFKVKVLTK